MADDISITIQGLDKLDAKLKELGPRIAKRALRPALEAGGEVLRNEVENNAPVLSEHVPGSNALEPGALKADIQAKVTISGAKDTGKVSVGPGKNTAHVAYWVEFGHRLVKGGSSKLTKDGKARGSGHEVGSVPEHPFLRPSFDAAATQAVDTFIEALRGEVDGLIEEMGNE